MERLKPLLEHNTPCGARDECVRLLLARGAGGYNSDSPVMVRIVREAIQFARVLQLINEAVVGMVLAWQQ
ncbi:hypothetical protein FOA52_004419 [Chlamydomonas sp. UWO 241]|nr:hypothetical protein FOA52_004419 [Chlamydomonas sp. UWO 241]